MPLPALTSLHRPASARGPGFILQLPREWGLGECSK